MIESPQLAPDEPLSPELVLVLPPALRAQALASLGPPAWPKPRQRAPESAAPVRGGFLRPAFEILAGRAVQSALIFAAVTALTLAMSLVAHAFH